MPTEDRIEGLIALVERGEFVAALEEFYAEDASMQENLGVPRVGLPELLANERRVLAGFEKVQARCLRPVLAQGDHAVIHWLFEFTDRDGRVFRLDELALQRWQGERVAEERFYYDPSQLRP